jgi:hypothetical protein
MKQKHDEGLFIFEFLKKQFQKNATPEQKIEMERLTQLQKKAETLILLLDVGLK